MIEFFPTPAIIAQIGSVQLHFYGAMYALSAVCAYFLIKFFAKKKSLELSNETVLDFVFWTLLGGVIGGRIFYALVYNFAYFRDHPGSIFAVWEGGMSIHGGLLGGALAAILFLRRKKIPIWKMAGIITPALALGLMLGRIGNFVNGELVGRVTDSSLGIDFGDGELRHPSQLYAALKDLVLFLIFSFLNLKTHISGRKMFGSFLVLYGIFRFTVEFFREPDPQIGLIWETFSMGQILSFFLGIVGLIIYFLGNKPGK